jgi:hypothetical protein
MTVFETPGHIAFVMGNIGSAEAHRIARAIEPGVRNIGL